LTNSIKDYFRGIAYVTEIFALVFVGEYNNDDFLDGYEENNERNINVRHPPECQFKIPAENPFL
jgi:hypothetical protein